MATLGLAIGMGLLFSGDTGVHGAVAAGIDPLEVLNLQIRNNALIVFDTSASMRWPSGADDENYGGDDPRSRMVQAKEAVKQVVSANRALMNFGLASYNILAADKILNALNEGEVRYATVDPLGARLIRRFSRFSNSWRNVDNDTWPDVLRSFESDKDAPFPIGCTPGRDCEVYFMASARFRHGVQFDLDLRTTRPFRMLRNAFPFTVTGTACNDYPPAGLTFDNPDADGDGTADQRRPWIKFVDDDRGEFACYYFTSGVFNNRFGSDSCGGAAALAPVAPCHRDGSQTVLDQMAPELPIGDYDPTQDFGLGRANVAVNLQNLNPSIVPAGLRTGQRTPIAAALDDIRNARLPFFPVDPSGGQQRNFVIFLTGR